MIATDLQRLLGERGLSVALNLDLSISDDRALMEQYKHRVQEMHIGDMVEWTRLLQLATQIRSENIVVSNLLLEKLESVNYGHGRVFTERCFNYFEENGIQHFGENAVSCISLGSHGRFGNQILQYMALTTLSKKLNLCPLAPRWIGNYIFNLGCSDSMPPLQVLAPHLIDEVYADKIWAKNFDIGEYQADLTKILSHRSLLRTMFSLNGRFNFAHNLREQGFVPESSLVIHIRLTDVVALGVSSKLDRIKAWLVKNLGKFPIDNIWIVTDDLSSLGFFAEFAGIKAIDREKLNLHYLDFLADWQLLQLSKYVLTAGSSFSTTASFLGSDDQVSFYETEDGALLKTAWSS